LSAVIPPPQGSGGGQPFDTNNPSFTGRATFEELEVETEVNINATEIGITASTTQSQGEQQLIATYNEVAVVANENDVVTLPEAVQGITVIVRNSGANTLQVFPAAGQEFLPFSVNEPFFIPPNSTAYFSCLNSTTWSVTSLTGGEIITINFIIDGGGVVITTGIKGHLIVDNDLEVLEWAAVSDQSGSIVVDVNRSTFANYPTTASIAGTELPTITTSTKGEDRTLTSWSDIDAGDVLEFEVDSITTCERVTVALKCRKI